VKAAMEIKKVEFLQRVIQSFGPTLDQDTVKKCLIALAIVADRDTGEELIRLLKQMYL
jgi:hypothetical protein